MEIEESVVVFCHHKYIHKLLHESLQEFNPSSIIGGQSDKIRQQNIDNFQQDVALASKHYKYFQIG